MIGVVIISDIIQIIKKVLENLARINILDIIQRLNVLDHNPVNKILETFQISEFLYFIMYLNFLSLANIKVTTHSNEESSLHFFP